MNINEYEIVTVWKKPGYGPPYKGVINPNGYKCNDIYSFENDKEIILSFEDYDHSEQFLAKVKAVDSKNLTGMIHLYKEWNDDGEENEFNFKSKLIGSELIVEKAHWAGDVQVYRSVYPKFEFWSGFELEIGEKIR